MNTEVINLAKEIGFNPILIFLVLLFIYLFSKIGNLIQFHDNIKSRKLDKIQQAISCENMPEAELIQLKSFRNKELYGQATGIYLDDDIRNFVIQLGNKLSINNKDLSLIQKYFKNNPNNAIIDITKLEWCFLFISKWVFILSATITLIIFIISMMLIDIIIKYSTILQLISIMFIMSLLVSCIYYCESRKYITFCKIYKSNHNIFKAEIPNLYWKIGSIILFCIIIFANVYFKV